MANPNNCSTCKHSRNPDGGFCYMFRDAPTTVCKQHTMRNTSVVGTTGSGSSFDLADVGEAVFEVLGDFLSSIGD